MPVCIRILLFYTGFKSQLKTQGANRTRLTDVLLFIGLIGLTAYSFVCKIIIFKTQGETACRGTDKEEGEWPDPQGKRFPFN